MPVILQNSTKGDDNLWVNSSVCIVTLSSNQMVEAQPSVTISGFADDIPFNEFDTIRADADIRFDFTASESSDFICNIYIIDIDLQENVFKRLLKSNDCGSGTSGSITYNDIALSQNQLQFNVLASGSSPIVGNETFTFFVTGGAFGTGDTGNGQPTGDGTTTVDVTNFWRTCQPNQGGEGELNEIVYKVAGISDLSKLRFTSNDFKLEFRSNQIENTLTGEISSDLVGMMQISRLRLYHQNASMVYHPFPGELQMVRIMTTHQPILTQLLLLPGILH